MGGSTAGCGLIKSGPTGGVCEYFSSLELTMWAMAWTLGRDWFWEISTLEKLRIIIFPAECQMTTVLTVSIWLPQLLIDLGLHSGKIQEQDMK